MISMYKNRVEATAKAIFKTPKDQKAAGMNKETAAK